jgi:hypothetical protein
MLAETCSECNYTQRIFACYRGKVFMFYIRYITEIIDSGIDGVWNQEMLHVLLQAFWLYGVNPVKVVVLYS